VPVGRLWPRKKGRLHIYTYPSTLVLSAGGKPLNVVRSTHSLLKHTNVAMMLDNEAISICRRS
jgi:tubulin alpha